jgi:TRAP-type transport system small permease protein
VEAFINRYCRLLEGVIVAIMAAMVVLVFGNVVMRYAFNSGITVSEELSRWLFVWMTFLGAVVGLKEHGHLGTDLLISRLGHTGKRVCLVIAQALMLWCTWLIFSGSLDQTRLSWEVQAPVSGLSMAWVSGVGVVFAVLAAPVLLRELWRTVSGQAKDSELVMVKESEDMAPLEHPHRDSAPGAKP